MSQKSEQIDKLAAALAKAQAEIKGAVKDSANPFFKSSYADLQSVWDAIRQPLVSNGLCVIQTTATNAAGGLELITTLAHSSGQWIEGRCPANGVKQVKVRQGNEVITVVEPSIEPQAIGSALSYMRRYSLAAIVGVYQTDDDGEAAQARHQPAQQPRQAVLSKPAPVTPKANVVASPEPEQAAIGKVIDKALGATGNMGAPFDLVLQKGPFAGKQVQELTLEQASLYFDEINGELKAIDRSPATLRGAGREIYYALAQYIEIKKAGVK